MRKTTDAYFLNVWANVAAVLMAFLFPLSYGFCGEVSSSAYYRGKTVTLIAAQAAKSGTDTVARTLLPFLQKNIPGNPAIVVENNGASGGAAAMHYYLGKAKHDGTTIILTSSGTVTRWVQKAKDHDYELTKLKLLLSTATGRIWCVHSRLGVKDVKSLKALSLTRPLKTSQTTTDSMPVGIEKMVCALLGIKIDQKFGYSDYGQPTLEALLKGEVDLSSVPGRVWSVALPYVMSGEIIPIFQDGVGPNLERAGNVPEVMNLNEAYKSLFGKDPDLSDPSVLRIKTYLGLTLQTPLWIHSDAPTEAIKAMQYAVDKMLHQPEFRDVSIDLVGTDVVDKAFIYGDRADKFLEEFFSRRNEINDIIRSTGASGG
jgi:tripartite-type tricarboxylate transporter receptor subunit TctC